MNSPELSSHEPEYDFSMEFDLGDFDINAAFQEAIYGVASDKELALEEKVRRMEVIVSEGTSDVYKDFVDFRMMASQIEMFCNHDHMLKDAASGSSFLSSFMDGQKDDGHNHGASLIDRHGHEDNDKYEIDPKTGKRTKKKKKPSGWLGRVAANL